ncbi:MAG: hypothetical protein QXI09_03075, partial [Candidatus Aenigmatarchaeota archaeon]
MNRFEIEKELFAYNFQEMLAIPMEQKIKLAEEGYPIILTISDLEKKEIKDLDLEKISQTYILDKNGNFYNLKDIIEGRKELPDDVAIEVINSPLFDIIEKSWKNGLEKSVEEEIKETVFQSGIEGLINPEKVANKIKERFEKEGKINELKEYLKERKNRADYMLIEPVNIDNQEIPFYILLEEKGIYWDQDGFLWKDKERIAYVGERIIPLKGKKQKLKESLEEIVKLRKEYFKENDNAFTQTLKNIEFLEELEEYGENRRDEIKRKIVEELQ